MLATAGPIPDSFGTADNLEAFDTKCNALTAMPAAWTNPDSNLSRSYLEFVRASFNSISVSRHPCQQCISGKAGALCAGADSLRCRCAGPFPGRPGQRAKAAPSRPECQQAEVCLLGHSLSRSLPAGCNTPHGALTAPMPSRGPLPRIPGMFPSLLKMNASYNQLSGGIPPEFATSALFSRATAVRSPFARFHCQPGEERPAVGSHG